MRSYLIDLFRVGWSSLRAYCHCLATMRLEKHRVYSLSSWGTFKFLGVEVPLERMDALVCPCGRVFYERRVGDGEMMLRIWEATDGARHGSHC